jgi:hypothetical protein
MTSSDPSQPAPPARPEARFGGWLLIVVGGLLAVLCGGCTLIFWGVGLVGLTQTPGSDAVGALIGLFLITGLIGGVPAAGGAVLVWAGWRVLHPLKTPRTVAKTFE